MAIVRPGESVRVVSWALVACIALLAAGGTRALAQTELETARTAITSAAYEDALATLSRLNVAPSSPEGVRVSKYRALCLLALDRTSEAEAAVTAVMRADPLYDPDNTDVTAPIKAQYASVRRRLLPTIVNEWYGRAKAAFDARDYAGARQGFRTTVDIIDAFPVSGTDGDSLSDVRRLAVGFFDLSVQLMPPPSADVTGADVIYDATTRGIMPPQPLRQLLPSSQLFRHTVGGGSVLLEIVIDESGNVESAVVRESLSGPIDRAMVKDVLQWRYRAAVLDGSPVRFRQRIRVSLNQ